MQPAPALEVKRVTSSEHLLNPGEYVFIEKRPPYVKIERTVLEPPEDKPDGTIIGNAFRYYKWLFFSKKYELKQVVEILWPERDTIILNCPACNGPCATTKNHKIISIEPLTLEIPLTCPYCKTKSYEIKDGKIMPA